MKKLTKKMAAVCFSMTLAVSFAPGKEYFFVQAAPLEDTTVPENEKISEEEQINEVIEIRDVKDFIKLLQDCQYDSFSIGKTVSLAADIDISSVEFSGIAYFSGTFEGNGHTITHVNVTADGSDYGFFRYLGENAVVNNLKLSGKVTAEGSRKNIGGIAGVNYGTINGCSFEGVVNGKNAVGAIAGVNKASGKIINCESNAILTATNQTGGIAGNNEGLISKCTSFCSINTQKLDTTIDLGGVDIGTLNLTQRVVDRNDMGGIAGTSTGIISLCTNKGAIGFAHTGYNVGGIAGRQSGKIFECVNEGEVYGRKDVGGIAGQAEPYIESEYLEDKVSQVQDSVNSINRTLNNMNTTISSTSSQAKAQMNALSNQYKESSKALADSLDSLAGSVDESNPQTKQYMDNIKNSLKEIENLQKDGSVLDKEQNEKLQNEWNNINQNLSNIKDSAANKSESEENFKNEISSQLEQSYNRLQETNNNVSTNIDKLTNTLNSGIQSVTNDVKKITNQIESIQNVIEDTASVVTGEEDYVEDISSAASAKDTDGVVADSINRGAVNGDLNVGGIIGTMNIEYDFDPEFDLDLTGSTNIALRSTVNNVVIRCINYGAVTSKKNCVGGITGLQELGLIYGSEGYGAVKSETGNYAGGIAGNSASAISDSYSLCNVQAKDYVGGITGMGYTVRNCISAPAVFCDGEGKGSIAGLVSGEGEVKNNRFVNENTDGIDNINYAGIADKLSYEEVMQIETIPQGFQTVTVTFLAEDEIAAEKTIAYNTCLSEEQLPQIPEKDGYYAVWPNDLTKIAVTENKVVEAEYIRWTESIAGNERAVDGRLIFLLEGEFYKDTNVQMSSLDAQITDGETVYAYEWSIDNLHEKVYDTVRAHFYVPNDSGKNEIWYQDENNVWVRAQSVSDGSYLVAEIPYAAAFALVHTQTETPIYPIAAGAAVVLVLIVIVKIVRKKAKKKNKRKEKK